MDDLSSNNRAGVSYSATRPAKQYLTRISERGLNVVNLLFTIIKGAEIRESTQPLKAKAFVFQISLLKDQRRITFYTMELLQRGTTYKSFPM